MEWPNTKSKSSATVKSMGVPDYGSSADRITDSSSNTGSVRTDKNEPVVPYENDKRMTEDFAASSDNGNKTSGFDGTVTIMPEGEPASSFINTSASKR